MEEKNMIEVTGENGEKFNAEVLEIFEVEGYPGKEYILYSFGETEGEDEKVYTSILVENEESYVLAAIEDPEEQAAVDKAVDELLEMSEEEREALEESDDENA